MLLSSILFRRRPYCETLAGALKKKNTSQRARRQVTVSHRPARGSRRSRMHLHCAILRHARGTKRVGPEIQYTTEVRKCAARSSVFHSQPKWISPFLSRWRRLNKNSSDTPCLRALKSKASWLGCCSEFCTTYHICAHFFAFVSQASDTRRPGFRQMQFSAAGEHPFYPRAVPLICRAARTRRNLAPPLGGSAHSAPSTKMP